MHCFWEVTKRYPASTSRCATDCETYDVNIKNNSFENKVTLVKIRKYFTILLAALPALIMNDHKNRKMKRKKGIIYMDGEMNKIAVV